LRVRIRMARRSGTVVAAKNRLFILENYTIIESDGHHFQNVSFIRT
jgi:hypothetical protein